MAEVQNENQAQQSPNGGPGVPPQGLTLNDLKVVISIIETCSERGAFQAGEMVAVGTTYNKIVAFVASQTPPPAANEEASADKSAEQK